MPIKDNGGRNRGKKWKGGFERRKTMGMSNCLILKRVFEWGKNLKPLTEKFGRL